MAKSDGHDYFRRTSLFWIVAITLSVGYFTCIVFAPEVIPYEHLGPFGTFCRYLVDNHAGFMYNGWWISFAIHVGEAVVSLIVCSNKGVNSLATRLLWFVQTFLFGAASLALLLKFDPKRPKQH